MFKKLLVPLDGSPLAEEAIGCAAAIARSAHASVDVVLVHQPFPYSGYNDPPWNAESLAKEDEYLTVVANELRTGAGVPTTHAVLEGETIVSVSDRARDTGADLIVMTSHGRTGLSRAWLGSVAEGVLRRSPVPILVLRPVKSTGDRRAAHHLFKRVLVPLDGSALSMDILPAAAMLARCSNAGLVLLRIVQPVPLVTMEVGVPYVYPAPIPDDAATERIVDEAKQDLADIARGLATHGLEIETHVVVDPHVATGIMDFARAQKIDAIAMSTHGRGVSRLFLGSVTDKVLRAAGLPVLVHRPVEVRVEKLLELEAATSAAV